MSLLPTVKQLLGWLPPDVNAASASTSQGQATVKILQARLTAAGTLHTPEPPGIWTKNLEDAIITFKQANNSLFDDFQPVMDADAWDVLVQQSPGIAAPWITPQAVLVGGLAAAVIVYNSKMKIPRLAPSPSLTGYRKRR